jgi:hypothetical protein
MAINKVPFPLNVPASVADYQKQNALLLALVKSIDPARKVVGSNVVKGAVFNVGGTLYLADADTGISGVASDYVKLTPSGDTLTLAASFVASLSGVAWNSEYKGYYDGSGNLYEFEQGHPGWKGKIKKLVSGSGNWMVPVGVFRIKVKCIGGGGAGGNGGQGPGSSFGGGGGGGGGTDIGSVIADVLDVSPGDSIAYSVGGPGVQSTFTGATTGPAGSPGTAGSSNGGGGRGGAGATISAGSCGEGGSNGNGADAAFGGTGGGAGGLGGLANYVGSAGNIGGGGGGGGPCNSYGSIKAGGSGGPGIIIIEY